MSNTVMHKFAICILKMENIPATDRLHVVCKEEFLDAGLLRRFAVAQAQTCRKYVADKKEFDRILKVCSRFAEGKATEQELADAWSAARSTAEYAAESAAESAAWYAAWSATNAAAWYAAWSAAWTSASVASAASEASEAKYAAMAARPAAYSSACEMLVTMTKEYYSK